MADSFMRVRCALGAWPLISSGPVGRRYERRRRRSVLAPLPPTSPRSTRRLPQRRPLPTYVPARLRERHGARSKRAHGAAFDALLADAQKTLYGARSGEVGPLFGPPRDFGPPAENSPSSEFSSNTGENDDGRGGFRTCDLSRVKSTEAPATYFRLPLLACKSTTSGRGGRALSCELLSSVASKDASMPEGPSATAIAGLRA